GQQGQQNLPVVVTGQATHFVQGTSQVSFGAGITINSVTVASATSLTANISMDASAATGTRTVTVTTGTEAASFNNGFTVLAGTPVLVSANPNSGPQGAVNLPIVLTGQFTHWVQGTSTVNFGDLAVGSFTVNSSMSATAVLAINPTAAVGPRTITVT